MNKIGSHLKYKNQDILKICLEYDKFYDIDLVLIAIQKFSNYYFNTFI